MDQCFGEECLHKEVFFIWTLYSCNLGTFLEGGADTLADLTGEFGRELGSLCQYPREFLVCSGDVEQNPGPGSGRYTLFVYN